MAQIVPRSKPPKKRSDEKCRDCRHFKGGALNRCMRSFVFEPPGSRIEEYTNSENWCDKWQKGGLTA